jgi:hypothetical protein
VKFYILSKPNAGSAEDRTAGTEVFLEEGFKTGPAPQCSNCQTFLGMLSWLPPYRVKLETWGHEYGDLVREGDDLIVSDRFVEMFRQAGLQGLDTFEPIGIRNVVNRRGKPKERIPAYFKTTVHRGSATVDQAASGYEWAANSTVCPVCLWGKLKRCRSTIINPATWNGDDIFFPRGGTPLVVTERFKIAFEAARLRNGVFVSSEDYGYDNFPWEKHGHQ